MSKYFNTSEAAGLYDRHRPRVHRVVLDWLGAVAGGKKFGRAVDVACGTGHSSLPLLDISDELICIDDSASMLEHARAKGFDVRLGSYRDLPIHGRFDLITTCMAFHWFDTDDAVASYKQASNPDALWLVYNFGFLGHETSKAFNNWLKRDYFTKYPSPSRNPYAGAISRADPDIELKAEARGVIPVTFDVDALVGYLMTQSNIEEAVRQGRSYGDIAKELARDLSGISIEGNFRYGYTYEIFQYAGR